MCRRVNTGLDGIPRQTGAGWLVSLCVFGLVPAAFGVQVADPYVGQDDSAHLEQLRNIREGITDAEARPADRRRWASVLLSYNTPQAKALVAELLSLSDRPAVQEAICSVIVEEAPGNPEKIDASFVDPLIELLGATKPGLRELAAGALADIPGPEVPARLGALADQVDVALAKRLAAIDALARNTHRREVVAQLVALLDAAEPEVVDRVTVALTAAAPESFGPDVQRWRRWWRERSQLDEEAWLDEQLRICRERSRRVADEFAAFREETGDERAAITARTRGFQRELFRVLPADQRQAKLVEWLGDPIPVVKLQALAIIRARIADEGQRPEGAVLNALLEQLRRGSPDTRREVIEILQTLNDPTVVEAVLARLPREGDERVRHAILKALGKLASPAAIPSLVAEIASPNSSPACVREAAVALGTVAAPAAAKDQLGDAVTALKSRYQSTETGDTAMRSALLTAMAGVASDEFLPEFMSAIESDDEAILGPAIRGVLALDGRSKLPRLRTLMGHADPRVRLAAIDAVGQLGREQADLEGLLTRLNPAIEANALARDAAWRGFRQVAATWSMDDRISAADRLRDLPELQIRYLEELADALSSVNGDTDQLEKVLDRLAGGLVASGRYEEAVAPLRALFDLQAARSDASTPGTGLRLLNATMRGPSEAGLATLITRLAALSPDEAFHGRIAETVGSYLETLDPQVEPDRLRRLLTELDTVGGDVLGDAWVQVLRSAAEHLPDEEAVPESTSPPSTPED
jgi:HEAT repeat protein